MPAGEADDRYAQVAKEAGFSLHAGVAAQAWERDKLERLCRYISRPGVSEKRLSLTSTGNIRYNVHGCTNAASAGCARAASSRHRTVKAGPMSGAQPMSEANAFAVASAQRGPRSALAIGSGTTHVAALAHPCASRHSCIHAH
ncbi:MAG: hypothetical protein GY948_24515, partial [Alphaproteobacteria bacterium]|nr:hypothetical protein [Alphaproteobacteria bacterium]